jgi:hypothetical protein
MAIPPVPKERGLILYRPVDFGVPPGIVEGWSQRETGNDSARFEELDDDEIGQPGNVDLEMNDNVVTEWTEDQDMAMEMD